jgi:hypothetical protein
MFYAKNSLIIYLYPKKDKLKEASPPVLLRGFREREELDQDRKI